MKYWNPMHPPGNRSNLRPQVPFFSSLRIFLSSTAAFFVSSIVNFISLVGSGVPLSGTSNCYRPRSAGSEMNLVQPGFRLG